MNYYNIVCYGLSGALAGSYLHIITKDILKKIKNKNIEYSPNIINIGFFLGFCAGAFQGYFGIPIIYYILSVDNKLK